MLEPYNEGDWGLFYAIEAIVVAWLGSTCSLEMDGLIQMGVAVFCEDNVFILGA